MTDPLEQRIIEIVQEALRNKGDAIDVVITADDSMETVPAWDSLSFMSVCTAINEVFSVSPDFDDAIHYTSVRTLFAYTKEQVA